MLEQVGCAALFLGLVDRAGVVGHEHLKAGRVGVFEEHRPGAGGKRPELTAVIHRPRERLVTGQVLEAPGDGDEREDEWSEDANAPRCEQCEHGFP